MNIRTTDTKEIEAVKAGEIEGDIYRDGEVWISEESLWRWLARPLNGTKAEVADFLAGKDDTTLEEMAYVAQ